MCARSIGVITHQKSVPMEQPILVSLELEPISFPLSLSDYAALGLEPKAETLQCVRDFARMYRPL